MSEPSLIALDRRSFIKAGAALAGSLIIDFAIPLGECPAFAQAAPPPFAPNAFIRIDRHGVVTLVMPMVEMGQGVYTAMAMLLAEELEVALEQVRLEHAPPDDALYANAILQSQTTGLSSTIRAFWTPLRQAGAMARTMLVAAAAKQWSVDVKECRARRRRAPCRRRTGRCRSRTSYPRYRAHRAVPIGAECQHRRRLSEECR